jgi:uncharacterized protein (TIGR00730 family)
MEAPQDGQAPPIVQAPALNRAARKGEPTEDEKLLECPGPDLAAFRDTDPWRVWRIVSEFVEGFDALADVCKAVTIFGSARVKPEDPMYSATRSLARLLGEEGYTIITGGGPGIMEAGNVGAQEAGVRSVGLGIQLPFEQSMNAFIDVPVEFRYFFARKTMFLKYAQAFVIFPGGYGTMDELFEALTLIQTGKIRNFPVVLYNTAYWRGLVDWLRETMLAEGKVSPGDLQLFLMADSPEEARDIILRAHDDPEWRIRQEEGSRQGAKRALQGEW